MENKYNNHNKNNAAYVNWANNKEYGATYVDGTGTNTTHENSARYPPTPATNNTPENYEQETMDKNNVGKAPGIWAAEEI